MANDHLEQSIGNIYLQDNETDGSTVGQAYLEPKTRKLFVKIAKNSHEPYTIPKHRVIFEHSTNKFLLLENIYNKYRYLLGQLLRRITLSSHISKQQANNKHFDY